LNRRKIPYPATQFINQAKLIHFTLVTRNYLGALLPID
jgi:hypothetical protein